MCIYCPTDFCTDPLKQPKPQKYRLKDGASFYEKLQKFRPLTQAEIMQNFEPVPEETPADIQ